MNESNDRASKWVQMWLDVSSENSEYPAYQIVNEGGDQRNKPSEEEDFENNGLVIMQRRFMNWYEKLPPEEQTKLRSRTPASPSQGANTTAKGAQNSLTASDRP